MPRGRPKGSRNKNKQEVVDLIDSCADMESVIRGLVKLAPRNPKAAEILLAYRYGKPKQELDLNHAGSVNVSLVEARTIVDHLFNGHPGVDEALSGEVGAGPEPVQDSEQSPPDRLLDGDSV